MVGPGLRLWVVLGSPQEEVMSKLRPQRGIGVRQVKVLERQSRQGDQRACRCKVKLEGGMWGKREKRRGVRGETSDALVRARLTGALRTLGSHRRFWADRSPEDIRESQKVLKQGQKGRLGGSLGGSVVWRLPLAQGAILESRDRVPRRAPGMELASPSACDTLCPLSLSLSLCLS